MRSFGRRSFSDPQHPSRFSRQHYSHDLVRSEFVPNRRPRCVEALIEEVLLDDRQQVICQNAEKDVRLSAVFEMMGNRPLHQWTLHIPECVFDTCE